MEKPPVTWSMRFLLAGMGTMAALTLITFCYVVYFCVMGEWIVAMLVLLCAMLFGVLTDQLMRFVRLEREYGYAKMETS